MKWNSFDRKDHAGLTRARWSALRGGGRDGRSACLRLNGRPARGLSDPLAIEENKGLFHAVASSSG